MISSWRLKDRYYRILGNRCKNCSARYFPPQRTCRKCGSRDMEDCEMPRQGRLVTYTLLYEPMEGFQQQIPLVLGIVELEPGVRLPAQIVDALPDAIRIGARVEAVFRRMKEDGESGQISYGYKFRIIS